MSAIGPGDMVECVDARRRPYNGPEGIVALRQLQVGNLYRVTDVGLNNTIFLAGVRAAFEDELFGWVIDRFRPVYRPSQSTLISDFLKSPARPRVEA